jgi:hypothetical protein
MGLDLDQISASLVLHNRFLSSGEGTDLEFCQMSYINTICCQPTGLLTKTKQDMEIHPLRAFFTAWLLWDLTFLFLVAWKYQVLRKCLFFLLIIFCR